MLSLSVCIAFLILLERLKDFKCENKMDCLLKYVNFSVKPFTKLLC